MTDTARITDIASGLANAGAPLKGAATAGQPEREHLRRLAGAGYRTVVDLRAPQEPRGYAEYGPPRRCAALARPPLQRESGRGRPPSYPILQEGLAE